MNNIIPKAVVRVLPKILKKGCLYAASTLTGMAILDGVEKITVSNYHRKISNSQRIAKDKRSAKWYVTDKHGNVLYDGPIRK